MGVKIFQVFQPSQIVNLVSSENRFGNSVDAILHITQSGSFCVEVATVFSLLLQIWDWPHTVSRSISGGRREAQ